jgi:outer membrane protein TolC
MDGSGRITPRTGRSDRPLSLSTINRRSPITIALVIILAYGNIASPADRPSLLQRIGLRAREKPVPASEIPPSPASAKPLPATALIQSSNETDESADSPVTNDTNEIRRFPQKSGPLALSGTGTMETALDLEEAANPIDIPTALKLAGITAPDVLLAQQRVLAVTARQQLAAAQALPNLNLGMNYDSHTGALQRASGAILKVERSALYVGAGANAVAAGSVNIPGLQYNLNVGEAYFGYLASRQQSERARAAAVATQNDTLLQVAVAYCQLVQAQGTRAIAIKAREDAAEVARITRAFARSGQGRPADAERAATEVGLRDADILAADAAIIDASARLGQILNLDTSMRLESNENWIVPRPVVPDLIPLPELIVIALYQRPEVAERRAEVHAAMLELDGARLLLFSPQFISGFSDGSFGGGSNVNNEETGRPRFGSFANRTDEDVVLYWSIRNLGLANKALIKLATARLAATNWEQTRRLNEIRAEVANAYARTQARAGQLDIRHRAIETSERGFRLDLERARAGEGHPIEVLDSLRLLARARQEYLETITAYNQAQYELYVAIGQPPADLLIHSNPPIDPELPAPEPK